MGSWFGRGRTLNACITLCCLSTFVLFGWKQGISGLTLENEDCLEQFGHPTELLPLYARTQGTAVGTSSNWMWSFVVSMITPVVLDRLQWKAYLIFFATNAISVPLVYFLYPEKTGDMRLGDVDLIFTAGRNPVVVGEGIAKMKKAGVEVGVVGELAVMKDVAVVETENINESA